MYSVDELAKYIALEDITWGNCYENIKKCYSELKNEKIAYYTRTWLLDSEIKEILPTDSNILKFQNNFNIIEYEENVNNFLNFVFEKDFGKVNCKVLPERTTLQSELKKIALNSDKLNLGLGFLEVSTWKM